MSELAIVIGKDTPILRTRAVEIPVISKEIKSIIKNMLDTVDAADGLGLAAPQVGLSLRLCIVKIQSRFIPLINPLITWKSDETDIAEEGCLSLPKFYREVRRPTSIVVTYTDQFGKDQERRLTKLAARIVQHEIDHLDGILIVDKPLV